MGSILVAGLRSEIPAHPRIHDSSRLTHREFMSVPDLELLENPELFGRGKTGLPALLQAAQQLARFSRAAYHVRVESRSPDSRDLSLARRRENEAPNILAIIVATLSELLHVVHYAHKPKSFLADFLRAFLDGFSHLLLCKCAKIK